MPGLVPYGSNDSELLILGSYPSEQSLKKGCYYANPTNRFWKVASHLSCSFQLWDVIAACQRKGSSDASIQVEEVNNIALHVQQMPNLRKVLCNGRLSYQLMQKHFPTIPVIYCPSTSAANAAWSLDRLIEYYQKEAL